LISLEALCASCGWRFKMLAMDERRVDKVRVSHEPAVA